MNLNNRDIRCVVLLATTIATAASGNSARAQMIDDFVEDAETRQEARAVNAAIRRQPVVWRNFSNQFSLLVRSEFGTLDKARGRLEIFLSERFDELERCCELTESQRKKLNVAAQGDIKRFEDRLDRVARALENYEINVEEFRHQQQELRELQWALKEKVFGAGSLFSKTIANTLDSEQRASVEKAHRDQMVFLYQEAIVRTAKSLAGVLKLTKEQRGQLEILLMEETHPPKKFGQSDYAFVMYQASKLPEAKLRPIFDKAQWRRLTAQLASWRATEEFLKTDGFILAEESIGTPATDAKPAAKREKTER